VLSFLHERDSRIQPSSFLSTAVLPASLNYVLKQISLQFGNVYAINALGRFENGMDSAARTQDYNYTATGLATDATKSGSEDAV